MSGGANGLRNRGKSLDEARYLRRGPPCCPPPSVAQRQGREKCLPDGFDELSTRVLFPGQGLRAGKTPGLKRCLRCTDLDRRVQDHVTEFPTSQRGGAVLSSSEVPKKGMEVSPIADRWEEANRETAR